MLRISRLASFCHSTVIGLIFRSETIKCKDREILTDGRNHEAARRAARCIIERDPTPFLV